jgi:signal peptidase I
MVPTLTVGQRVLVNRFIYHFTDPGVGDIVVFNPPKGANRCGVATDPSEACPEPVAEKDEDNFIKRVVAEPGDRLRIEDGIPIVNGEPVDDPNWEVRPCGGGPTCNLREEIEIPEDHYFMMGDNRGHSDDSRIWGPVPRDWIIGKAFLTYWPPGRWGIF